MHSALLRAGSRLWPPSLGILPSEPCRLAGLTSPLPPVVGRNAAGKDGRECLGGSVLEQIPFLQNCEDEDSDEDDGLDSVQHKKQRVKVSSWPQGRPLPAPPSPRGPPVLCISSRVPLWVPSGVPYGLA